jgi:hypothetical protein
MTADRTPTALETALDAAHAVLIAAWDATRFHTDPDLGGLVGRLRRLAAAANEATLRGCQEPARGGDAAADRRRRLLGAGALLRELAECVEAARRRGLDLAAAGELLEYQTHATLALGALLAEGGGGDARAA